MSGETFITTGVVMVPNGVSPTTTKESKTENGFNAVYDSMYQKLGKRPYCFAGPILWKRLEAIAIAKAPVHGKNIFKNKAEYHSQPGINITNVHSFIVGCAAKFEGIKNEALKTNLGRGTRKLP